MLDKPAHEDVNSSAQAFFLSSAADFRRVNPYAARRLVKECVGSM